MLTPHLTIKTAKSTDLVKYRNNITTKGLYDLYELLKVNYPDVSSLETFAAKKK